MTGARLQANNARLKQLAGYQCALCGKLTVVLQIDHTIPLSQGGRDDDSNRQVLCSGPNSCHERKTLQEAAEGKRKAGMLSNTTTTR